MKTGTTRQGMTPREEMRRIEERLAGGNLTDQVRQTLASRWNELKTEEEALNAYQDFMTDSYFAS